MGVKVELNTYSIYYATSDNIEMHTYYIEPSLSDILLVNINKEFQYINNILINQGCLYVIGYQNWAINTDLDVDNSGNLLLFAESESEADKYSIDSSGHLIYTETI